MPDPTSNVPRDLRMEYALDHLDEREVLPDAIAQFERWFGEAQLKNLPEPNAMTLATADASGAPSARVVLLKAFDARGFVFFTNYDSRKGCDLAANPRAALCFYWPAMERQVRVEGVVEKTNRGERDHYFSSRPVGGPGGAWGVRPSEGMGSRGGMDRRRAEALGEICRHA